MKKIRIAMAGMVLILAGAIAILIKIDQTPGKYAVKESDFNKYKPFILVQEVHYTGTGWAQTGDENGFFQPEEYADIDLVNGNVLPQMDLYDEACANTFLCKVEYQGKTAHAAFEEEIDFYNIVEWYPVYPVLRDTILPGWLYSKEFMTKKEIPVKGITTEKVNEEETPREEDEGSNIKEMVGSLSLEQQELPFYARRARMTAKDKIKEICAGMETPVEKEVELSEPYAEAYYAFLKEESNLAKENHPLQPVGFRLAYIDDDDIPELLLMRDYSHAAGVWVYTCENGRVVEVGEFGSFGNMQYLENEGMIFSGFYNMGEGFSVFCKLENGKAEKIREFHQVDGEAFMEPIESVYEIDGVTVSEEEYNAKYNELWSDDFISIGYDDGVPIEDGTNIKEALAQEIENLEIKTELKDDLNAKQREALEAYGNFLIAYRPGFPKDLSDRDDAQWEYAADYGDSEGPKFTLFYLDGDEIPELAVVYGLAHAHGIYIYTFVDGEVVQVGDSAYGQYGGVGYMEKEGIIFSGHDSRGDVYDIVCRIEGTKEILLHTGSMCWVEGEDEADEGGLVYEVDGKETTREGYQAAHEKWNMSEEKIISYDRCFCVPRGNIEGSVNRAMKSLMLGQEEYLKEKALAASGYSEDEILRFVYDDFDRDGSYEAFIFLEKV